MKTGDLVQYWYDAGGGKSFGMTILYGKVIAAGPKAYRVRWESGLTNRLQQDRPDVELAHDQHAAAQAMARCEGGK